MSYNHHHNTPLARGPGIGPRPGEREGEELMLFDCSYCEEAFDNLLSARNHEIDKHAKQYHYKAGKESLAFVEKLQREITLTLVEARQHFDAAAKEDNNDS